MSAMAINSRGIEAFAWVWGGGTCLMDGAGHVAEKPSLCQPAELRNKPVTKSFPNSSFSNCLSVRRSRMAVELCCSSAAVACFRFGGRLSGAVQRKIEGPISRGLQWSCSDSHFFGLLGSTDHSLVGTRAGPARTLHTWSGMSHAV